ncbi:MAG: DUF4367 domain-containing protein [Bacillota bacterium]
MRGWTTNGWASITWIEDRVMYEISGRLSPEEVLRMAESMEEV